jgi:hypothetical protein
MDMWKAFRKSTLKAGHAPQAGILYDKFHVLNHLSDAMDKVRKSECTRPFWPADSVASAFDFGKKRGCADHSPLDLLRMI